LRVHRDEEAEWFDPSRDISRMALLDDVIEASGGMDCWNRLKRFTLQLSIDGVLFSKAGQSGRFKDIAAEGSTQTQLVRFTGFSGPGKCGAFQPQSVTIEDPNGRVLRSWNDPQQSFCDHAKQAVWDELHMVFFCGFSVWNYLTTPFLLTLPEIRVEELPPWPENGQLWRRLRAVFPPTIVTHCPEQVFYFDDEGLQRRMDHDLLGTRVAQYLWAHQLFSGILVPTLRRSLTLKPDGTVIAKPSLLDMEIFDAAFD
jgi:hypothetical protein